MNQRSERAITHLTLAHLEIENAKLREQAIKLMIERHILRDGRAGRDRLHLSEDRTLACDLGNVPRAARDFASLLDSRLS